VENETALSASPAQISSAPAAWFARLGLSGKILGIAALVGVFATFLPGMTISMEAPALKSFNKAAPNISFNTSQSFIVLSDFRGKVALMGFISALALLYMLYPAGGLAQKPLCWLGVGAGGLATLMSLWFLAAVLGGSGSMNMGFMGIQSSPGIGAFVSLLAGLGVTAGALFKAREEQLI
jgi:hypothetical protein